MSKRSVLLYGLLVATLGAQTTKPQRLTTSNCAFLDVASNGLNKVNERISSDTQTIRHCDPILVNLVQNDDGRTIYGTIVGEPGAIIQWSFQRMGKTWNAPVVIKRGSLRLDENGLVPSHNRASLYFVLSKNGKYRLLAAATDGLGRQDNRSELNASHDGVASSTVEIDLDTTQPRKKNFIARHPVGFAFMAIFLMPVAVVVAVVTLISHNGK